MSAVRGRPLIYISYGITKSGSTLAFQLARTILDLAGFAQVRLSDTATVPGRRINFVERITPAIEASLVKDLGTIYQQDLPEIARVLAESDATTEEDMADFLDVAQHATVMAPSYTIQGGTTQVLRGIVARGLGLR